MEETISSLFAIANREGDHAILAWWWVVLLFFRTFSVVIEISLIPHSCIR